jgi:hypothetical protein
MLDMLITSQAPPQESAGRVKELARLLLTWEERKEHRSHTRSRNLREVCHMNLTGTRAG